MKSGNFKWMKEKETKKSQAVSNTMRAAGNKFCAIAIKGKNKKAFEGFK